MFENKPDIYFIFNSTKEKCTADILKSLVFSESPKEFVLSESCWMYLYTYWLTPL